jgi:hypothetical protein
MIIRHVICASLFGISSYACGSPDSLSTADSGETDVEETAHDGAAGAHSL